jgi:hypothetical protein
MNDDNMAALCKDLHNAADHWSGGHFVCREIDPERKCVKEEWGDDRAYYTADGATHVALKS